MSLVEKRSAPGLLDNVQITSQLLNKTGAYAQYKRPDDGSRKSRPWRSTPGGWRSGECERRAAR